MLARRHVEQRNNAVYLSHVSSLMPDSMSHYNLSPQQTREVDPMLI